MAKASDNVFPKVQFSEEAAPATPASGQAVLYSKADGKPYWKDDAGTETDLTATGGGGGGSSYLSDPNLKPPDSPHASDVEFLGLANATSLATAGLTWANQGSKAADIKGGRLTVHIPAADTSHGGLVVAAPSGSFSVSTRLRVWPIETHSALGLLIVNDSPLGTFANWREAIRSAAESKAQHITLNSSWVTLAGRGDMAYGSQQSDGVYIRFAWDDSTSTLSSHFTADPSAGWTQRASVVHSSQPPTHVGFLLSGENSGTYPLYGSFDFLRFDWTPDFDPTV